MQKQAKAEKCADAEEANREHLVVEAEWARESAALPPYDPVAGGLPAFEGRCAALAAELGGSTAAKMSVWRSARPSEYLLGATVVHTSPCWKVIAYRYLPGTHVASRSGDFVQVVRELRGMHRAGLCHGDVRSRNMVFNGATSHLIDFDYCVLEAHGRLYPPNWNRNIDDGARHAGARAGMPMTRGHDVFALHAVMSLYEAPGAREAWAGVLAAFASPAKDVEGTLTLCIDQLTSLDCELKLLTDKIPRGMQGSGSPEK